MTRNYIQHGMSRTKEYRAWISMKERCNNPDYASYANYGGRGITVCDAWSADFLSFYGDIGDMPGKGHELDRIDNEKGYGPDNCRWVTSKENLNNKRTSHKVEWHGEILTLTQWSERLGIHQRTLFNRIGRGWSLERALTTPTNQRSA